MGLAANLKQLVGRPIQRKFKSALPAHGGDGLILSMLGRIVSRAGLAEKAYGEGEVFLIKGGLFMSGVRLDPSAYEGIGTVWKEDLGQHHYNPSAGLRRPNLVPYALHLPHGLYTPLYQSPKSPLVLRREGGTLYLYLDDLRLFPVEYEKRPAYYSRSTSTGAPMPFIGPHRLRRQVLFEYNAYCRFFSDNTQCLFCGIISEKPPYHGHYQRYFVASPEEVGEVAEAAYSEGDCSELQITGGVLPGRAEVPYILDAGRAIKSRLGVDTIPGSQAVLVPPSTLSEIDGLKEAGWQGVAFNLEIWDPRLWPGIVPGKAAVLPREGWLEALEYAVGVFGKGQVTSVLVAGLEPKGSHWEGVEWLAERGIYGVPIPWSPTPGSPLEGHQTPTAAWHLELAARTLDIWERYGLDPHRHSSGGLHYADLATMRQHLKELQGQLPRHDVTQDLRYSLAVDGKLPAL